MNKRCEQCYYYKSIPGTFLTKGKCRLHEHQVFCDAKTCTEFSPDMVRDRAWFEEVWGARDCEACGGTAGCGDCGEITENLYSRNIIQGSKTWVK